MVRFTLTVAEPSLTIVSEDGAFTTQGRGDVVAVGEGDGSAVAVGEGFAVGVGEGVAVGEAFGSAVGVGLGAAVGVGLAPGEGDGDGEPAPGVAPGSGSTLPPGPVSVAGGTEASKNLSVSKVTSPDPVTWTFTWFLPLSNPNDSSFGMRPRQSNAMVFIVVNLTPRSRSKFRVLTAPNPSQSIVMA